MRELTPNHVMQAALRFLGTDHGTRNRKPHGSGHETSATGSVVDEATGCGVVEEGSVLGPHLFPGQEAEITSWRHG